MDPGFPERVSYVKMCVCVCACVRVCAWNFACVYDVALFDFIYFFLKYPMKMKQFGLTETKLFHFHWIF